MIDTETVMPRVARQQTRGFTTVVRSLVEAEEAEASSTMKAIYLERKTGAESLVAGEIPRPSPECGRGIGEGSC